jgi:hypothetical protein
VTGHYAGTGNAVESISFTVVERYGYALGTGSYNLATSASGGNGRRCRRRYLAASDPLS